MHMRKSNNITCFIFLHTITTDTHLSLCMDVNGKLTQSLALRSIVELRALPHEKTLIVLPTNMVSIHKVELPWLAERKARIVLAYALEDMLAQAIDAVHLAFNKAYYANKHYLIAVIDKQRLNDIIQYLDNMHINFDCITLDWCALKANEACITPDGVLMYVDDFRGILPINWLSTYEHASSIKFKTFNNTPTLTQELMLHAVNINAYEWLAKRLLHRKPLNFCQGLYTRLLKTQTVYWYYASLACFGLGLLLIILAKGLTWYKLNQQIQQLDQEITANAHKILPNIAGDPKVYIQTWLRQQAKTQVSSFWGLQARIATAIMPQQIEITSLQFQNNRLTLHIICTNFTNFDKFKTNLQQSGVRVQSIDTVSKGKSVIANLELTL